MADSTDILALFERQISDFIPVPNEPQAARRVVWYTSRQKGGLVCVLISWEAQCVVAGSQDLSTDDIFRRHAADFDRQIALMLLSREAPGNGIWTLDAFDIVPIL